jgi:quinohemoprotein amine dehydrogenase
VVAEVDVASNAALGRRDLALGRVVLPKATAVYDRVDYIKVAPEDALARLGGDGSPRPKGYAQFEVVAYSRGPDGKEGTADDIELGPADVNWSIEEFYESFDDDDKEFVGYLNSEGLFTPAIDGSNPQRKHLNDNRGNVWVVATAKSLKDRDNQPLTAKSYLVVAPPLYIMWDRETEP